MPGPFPTERRHASAGAIATIGLPSTARAAAGFADDGFGEAVLLVLAMLLLTVMATGFLAGRWSSAEPRRSRWQRLLIWTAAAPVPILLMAGIVWLAVAGHVVFAAAPFLAMALGFVAGRASSGSKRRWGGILAWTAAAFPLSAFIGIAHLALNWHLGVAAALADPATYLWGCATGAFACAIVLPAMLLMGLARSAPTDP
jgi:hypothetical protein